MSAIDDGGPAFPPMHDPATNPSGMSLRAHFAGLAMQGCLAGHLAKYGHEDYWKPSGVADHAVEYADALIAALKTVKP